MKQPSGASAYLDVAREVLTVESKAIARLAESLDENFVRAVERIAKCRERVVLTGMGKSGLICRKIAATLTSTGTQAGFLHPSEAMHGDLGIIKKGDVVIAVSNSGETREIVDIIPHVKILKATIIAMTANAESTLAQESDIPLIYAIEREGCPLNLAPMASTTTVLALGDALAAALIHAKKFTAEDFNLYHPRGRLGQILLKVRDLMVAERLPVVRRETSMREVLSIMVSSNVGAVFVAGTRGHLRGIISDGDIKRLIERDEQFMRRTAGEVMNATPAWIYEDALAREALIRMEERRITVLPALDRRKRIVGVIHIHDIIKHNYGKTK